MIDESRVLRKLQVVTDSLSKLEELACMDRDSFLSDFRTDQHRGNDRHMQPYHLTQEVQGSSDERRILRDC